MSAKVFVITGPSGVGKGTLIAELLGRVPELELSVSATTRPPREGESDGREYHFLSPEVFGDRVAADDFLEHATYSGHQYGTLRSEVQERLAAGRSVVLEIEVQGAQQIREAMPEAIQVFIAPPGPKLEDQLGIIRERLNDRGTDSPGSIEARMKTAEGELRASEDFAYRVMNDDLQKAASELEQLVRSQLSLD